MDYHLICIQPFGKYVKGQMITDAKEVASLLEDRDNHFIRIAIPAAPPVAFAGHDDGPKKLTP